MVVMFEFLGDEPLDNIITCLNFKVDKVVFFGYHEVIQRQKNITEKFLKKYCNVPSAVFHPLSHDDLESVLKVMRKEIEYEIARKNDIYFDITGGESLILVAFGALSEEYDTPMHMYDISKNRLIEFECGSQRKVSTKVPKQKIKLSIEQHIELRGGVVNYKLHKDIKGIHTPEFANDVAAIWLVAKKHCDYWNSFSDFLKAHMTPDEDMVVVKNANTVINALRSSTSKLHTSAKLNEILDDLKEINVFTDLEHSNGRYKLVFKNKEIKECLWDGGSILELHTFQKMKTEADDCEIGLHLDWDGVIHQKISQDVMNEVDVIALKNNILTFISCKSGATDKWDLYELETVARRFGGKYAKKMFVVSSGVSVTDRLRAEEMGVIIRDA